MPVPDSRPGLRKGGDTAEASPRRPDLNGNRSRAPGALAARPDPVRSGPHLRSGPRKTVRISGPMTGTPRVPAAGPVAPSTGFPARLRPVPNRPSVTRKAQRPTGARGRMAPGRRTQPLPFPPATPRAEGGGGHRRVLVDPSRRPPNAALRERGGGATTTLQTWRLNLPRAERAPTARRQRDDRASVAGLLELRLGNRGQIQSLADIADAPAGRRYIKADARWRETTGANNNEADPDRGPAKAHSRPPGRPISSRPASEGLAEGGGRAAPGAAASGAPGRHRRDSSSPGETWKTRPGRCRRKGGQLATGRAPGEADTSGKFPARASHSGTPAAPGLPGGLKTNFGGQGP